MNGGHDLGGTHGFGPVAPEPDEPVFHADWEKRLLGLYVAGACTGAWNIDMARFTREDRPAQDYLSWSYYRIWLAGLERLLLETGLVNQTELTAGKAIDPPIALKRVLKADEAEAVMLRGFPAERQVGFQPRFQIGDAVMTRIINPATHTRLPRYARGRRGTIHALHGAHVFPDAHAHGHGEAPHFLYTVHFTARELWGPDTTADAVYLNCWEPYLDPAG